MPTKLKRFILSFTDAQLEQLRLRWPGEALTDKERIYLQLGFEKPLHGGKRAASGRKSRPTK